MNIELEKIKEQILKLKKEAEKRCEHLEKLNPCDETEIISLNGQISAYSMILRILEKK